MLGQIESDGRAAIADMEAGIGTLTRMPENSFDLALVVADPSSKSIEVARRAFEIIAERKLGPILLVANKVRDDRDLDLIRAVLGDVEMVVVPEDEAILKADRDGLAPYDVARHSPAVLAIDAISTRL